MLKNVRSTEGREDCSAANSKVWNVSLENIDVLQFQESIKRSMCGEWRNIWSSTWLPSGLLKIPDSNLEMHQMHIAPKEEKTKGHCKSCDEIFLNFELNFLLNLKSNFELKGEVVLDFDLKSNFKSGWMHPSERPSSEFDLNFWWEYLNRNPTSWII